MTKAAHVVQEIRTGDHDFLIRQAPGQSEGLSARDDADLENRIATRQEPSSNCMSGLMICGEAFLLGTHDGLLALDASDHAVNCIGEVLIVNI